MLEGAASAVGTSRRPWCTAVTRRTRVRVADLVSRAPSGSSRTSVLCRARAPTERVAACRQFGVDDAPGPILGFLGGHGRTEGRAARCRIRSAATADAVLPWRVPRCASGRRRPRERRALWSPRDRRPLLAAADVLVVPSRFDPYAVVVLESAAAGTPVVVTPEVGAADSVRRFDAGLVWDRTGSLRYVVGRIVDDRPRFQRARPCWPTCARPRCSGRRCSTCWSSRPVAECEGPAHAEGTAARLPSRLESRAREVGELRPSRRRAICTRQHIESQVGHSVRRGPFAGMVITTITTGSHLPKRLGTYEFSLQPFVESLIGSGPGTVVNVGSGEGDYAVGLARRLANAQIYAYDADPAAARACRQNAAANGVAERVHVRGFCDPLELDEIIGGGAALVVDCEGGEDAAAAPRDRKGIVPLPDPRRDARLPRTRSYRPDPRAVPGTHSIRDVEQVLPPHPPEFEGLSPEEATLALDESRPAGQIWLVLEPIPQGAPARVRRQRVMADSTASVGANRRAPSATQRESGRRRDRPGSLGLARRPQRRVSDTAQDRRAVAVGSRRAHRRGRVARATRRRRG